MQNNLMSEVNKNNEIILSITESPSEFDNLEQMSVSELITNINREDAKVHIAVKKALPQVEQLVKRIVKRMREGGRVFYLGAGTSGRLGVLDASELPPTFGVPDNMVIGLIAGVTEHYGMQLNQPKMILIWHGMSFKNSKLTN